MTIVNPPELHDPTPFGYSHVVTASPGKLAFVGGQYASDATGRVSAGLTFEQQVERSFENLGVALRAAGLDFHDVVQLRTYIVDHDVERLEALGRCLHRVWGGALPAQTLTGVAALALPEIQFEVDAIAVHS